MKDKDFWEELHHLNSKILDTQLKGLQTSTDLDDYQQEIKKDVDEIKNDIAELRYKISQLSNR